MVGRLIGIAALTVCFISTSISVRAQGASTTYDASLKLTADTIVPGLERVTAYHPHMRPSYDSRTDPYLGRLKKVLKHYRVAHPGGHIQEAISLFSSSTYTDLTTKPNAKWDFIASPQLFGAPALNTITNVVNGKSATYRIYSTPFTIPKPFADQGFVASLAVYEALPRSSRADGSIP